MGPGAAGRGRSGMAYARRVGYLSASDEKSSVVLLRIDAAAAPSERPAIAQRASPRSAGSTPESRVVNRAANNPCAQVRYARIARRPMILAGCRGTIATLGCPSGVTTVVGCGWSSDLGTTMV